MHGKQQSLGLEPQEQDGQVLVTGCDLEPSEVELHHDEGQIIEAIQRVIAHEQQRAGPALRQILGTLHHRCDERPAPVGPPPPSSPNSFGLRSQWLRRSVASSTAEAVHLYRCAWTQ